MKKAKQLCISVLLGVLLFALTPALQVQAKTPATKFNAIAYNAKGYQYLMLTKGHNKRYDEKAITVIYGKTDCGLCDRMLKDAYEVYKGGASLKIIYVMAFSTNNAAYLKEKQAAYPGVEFADFYDKTQTAAWDIIKKEKLYTDLGGGRISVATPLTVIVPNDNDRYVSYVSTGYDANYKTELRKLAGSNNNSNTGGSGTGSTAGTWVKDKKGWRFRPTGGSYVENDWKKIDGEWYYFGSDTYMLKGWQLIKNKWYLLGGNGAMRTGWVKSGKSWYYLGSNGAMRTGWKKIEGKWYYFSKKGAMQTGWKRIKGIWYYLNRGGDMHTGWLQEGSKWYYLDNKEGMMLSNTTRVIDGRNLVFDSSGVCINR